MKSPGRLITLAGRSVLVRNAPDDWTPIAGTPLECPVEPVCPCIDCEHNTLKIPGSERPGRRHPNGQTAPDLVIYHGRSCVLDVCHRWPAGASTEVIATALGLRNHRRVEQVIEGALRKLRADPAIAVLVDHVEPVKVSPVRKRTPRIKSVESTHTTPRNLKIRLTVSVGSRATEIELSSDASRAVLRRMRDGTHALREASREIRRALGDLPERDEPGPAAIPTTPRRGLR